MKSIKSTFITFLSLFGLTATLLFSSCAQDPCVDLLCENGGQCNDGYCECLEGYEGAECEIKTASRFVGHFKGSLRCDQFPIDFTDVIINLHEDPNIITLSMGAGNTSILDMTGKAATPETHISTYVEELEATIHAYIRVDGDIIAVYLESRSRNTNYAQTCRFNGTRVK